LGYVYVPGHDEEGFNEFSRVLNASSDKQGLIIDERNNGGGITPDSLIYALQRSPILAYVYRYGKEFVVPPHWIDGPKVLMINEANGSAAETFALMFKAQKVGKLVGKTTVGAGIGAALYQTPLIDGGVIAIPNRGSYNPYSGRWEIENEGIHPDVDVEIMPADAMAGRDPQLDAAIAEALKGLKSYVSPKLKRPVAPVHPGGRKRT
jgi:tricorn protease